MKMIIAAEIFPPDIGGPATYSQQLADELAQKGWKIKLICYSSRIENDNYSYPVTRILRSQNTFNRYWQYFWHLFKIASDGDLIFAQGPVCAGLPAILVGQILNKKVIVKVTGDYAWEQARNLDQTHLSIDEFQKQKLTGKIAYLKKIEIWTCKKAKKVVVPSHYLKKIVASWGIPENKIIVIYNAIKKTSNEMKKIDTDKDIILSIGRLVPWKGFQVLIDLMPDLLQINPNLKLVILGDGPDKEKLHHQISQLDLNDKVEIKKVEPKIRDQYLKTAKLFVLNTNYEGLPHTVLEAMDAGVPVITTNVCGNPEVIRDGYNGILVEYNNKEQLKEAILKIYGNPELRQKLVDNSKEVLKKFSLEKMIDSTIAVLNNLK